MRQGLLAMSQISSESTSYDPGVVLWLPPYSGLPGDTSENGHPHALVVRAEPEGFGILAYGSTQDTEAGGGAERHSVKPRPAGRNPNGLPRLTHFYPGFSRCASTKTFRSAPGTLGTIWWACGRSFARRLESARAAPARRVTLQAPGVVGFSISIPGRRRCSVPGLVWSSLLRGTPKQRRTRWWSRSTMAQGELLRSRWSP